MHPLALLLVVAAAEEADATVEAGRELVTLIDGCKLVAVLVPVGTGYGNTSLVLAMTLTLLLEAMTLLLVEDVTIGTVKVLDVLEAAALVVKFGGAIGLNEVNEGRGVLCAETVGSSGVSDELCALVIVLDDVLAELGAAGL